MAEEDDTQERLRAIYDKNRLPEPEPASEQFDFSSDSPEPGRSWLRKLLVNHIIQTIDTLTGAVITDTYRQEWQDYVLMWNCARDPDHGNYMGEDVRQMLMRKLVPVFDALMWNYARGPDHGNYTGEDVGQLVMRKPNSLMLKCIDRKTCVEAFKEAVSELEDRIRSYWDKK